MRTSKFLALMLISSSTAPALSKDIVGKWQRGDGGAHVEITNCGASYCAANTWVSDTSGFEKVGDKLIIDVKETGRGVLEGEAYDPRRGLTYALANADRKLLTKGCILLGILCKSMTWTRLD